MAQSAPSAQAEDHAFELTDRVGKGRLIIDDQEKMHALEVLTEHLLPGRWRDTRRPTQQEETDPTRGIGRT